MRKCVMRNLELEPVCDKKIQLRKKLVEMRKWFIHNLKNNSPGIVGK
jgi:hypothetical protein